MICIQCNKNSSRNERFNGKCPNCSHPFAFEPYNRDPFSDKAFQNAIIQVSSDGQVRWGAEHLYYELCRRKRIKGQLVVSLAVFSVLVGSVCIALLYGGHGGPTWVGLAFAFALAIYAVWALRNMAWVRLSADQFRGLYAKWENTQGQPKAVIVRRPQPTHSKAVEEDLTDYSFDRAVICDRARTVDLLLANNFHSENNCAVLSIDGYPQGPFATVRKMLQRNPRLNVYALHDATVEGCTLAYRLANDPAWFAGNAKVIDVGLRPSHARRLLGMWQHAQPAEITNRSAITAWEAKWLAKHSLALAAIRPEQVLKRLYKAVSEPVDLSKAVDGVVYLAPRHGHGSANDVITTQTNDADGPADSFG